MGRIRHTSCHKSSLEGRVVHFDFMGHTDRFAEIDEKRQPRQREQRRAVVMGVGGKKNKKGVKSSCLVQY